jgi:hypothetical protein
MAARARRPVGCGRAGVPEIRGRSGHRPAGCDVACPRVAFAQDSTNDGPSGALGLGSAPPANRRRLMCQTGGTD